MNICAHPDCGYMQGYTHRGGEDNRYISGEFGDFFEFSSGFQKVEAWKLPNTIERYALMGCPKCLRTFISKGEQYEV